MKRLVIVFVAASCAVASVSTNAARTLEIDDVATFEHIVFVGDELFHKGKHFAAYHVFAAAVDLATSDSQRIRAYGSAAASVERLDDDPRVDVASEHAKLVEAILEIEPDNAWALHRVSASTEREPVSSDCGIRDLPQSVGMGRVNFREYAITEAECRQGRMRTIRLGDIRDRRVAELFEIEYMLEDGDDSTLDLEPDFAGYISIKGFGCGTGCQWEFLFDTRTGEYLTDYNSLSGSAYYLGSRLILVNTLEEPLCAACGLPELLLWDGERLVNLMDE